MPEIYYVVYNNKHVSERANLVCSVSGPDTAPPLVVPMPREIFCNRSCARRIRKRMLISNQSLLWPFYDYHDYAGVDDVSIGNVYSSRGNQGKCVVMIFHAKVKYCLRRDSHGQRK